MNTTCDNEKSDYRENEDVGAVLDGGQTVEVDNLGDKEDHQTDDRNVINSKQAIGDKGGHHGELEEFVARKDGDAVDGTK